MNPLDTTAVLGRLDQQSRRYVYVNDVLALYRITPGTSGLARAADRKLANQLFDLDVPLELLHAALVIGFARRLERSPLLPTLDPIACLHYFRPIIDELLAKPPEPGYVDAIRERLHTRAPALLRARPGDHRRS